MCGLRPIEDVARVLSSAADLPICQPTCLVQHYKISIMKYNLQPIPRYSFDELPAYWLNARQTIQQGMSQLVIGEPGKQTVSKKGSIKLYFHGEMCKWTSFTDEVLRLWREQSTVGDLERCAKLPVAPDPKIEELNPNAMTAERIQCGGEITVSGRFCSNALDPVIHCVETIAAAGASGPPDVTFGDAWIRDLRIHNQYPDVIGKVQIGTTLETRLIGEIKFPTTVDIAVMVKQAVVGKSTNEFRAILGQVVKYMLSHRLKYAFLTNYNATTCLKLSHFTTGTGVVKPQNAFSDTINANQTVDEKNVSVRLALFYLVNKAFSTDETDWRISQQTANIANDANWLRATPTADGPLNTPLGNRVEHMGVRVDKYSPSGYGGTVAPIAHTDPFNRQRANGDGEADSRSLQLHGQGSIMETPTKQTKKQLQTSYLNSLRDIDDTPVPKLRQLDSAAPQERPVMSRQEEVTSTGISEAADSIEGLFISDQDSRTDSDSSH